MEPILEDQVLQEEAEDSFDETEEEFNELLSVSVPDLRRTNDPEEQLTIQFQEYHQQLLEPELGSLAGQSHLMDVKLVCRHGHVFANSLLLGSMSPFLHQALAEVPVVDLVKVVVLPDLHVASVQLFMDLLFNAKSLSAISRVQILRLKQVARLFRIDILISNPVEQAPKNSRQPRLKTKPEVMKRKRPRPMRLQEQNVQDEVTDEDTSEPSAKQSKSPRDHRHDQNATPHRDKVSVKGLILL